LRLQLLRFLNKDLKAIEALPSSTSRIQQPRAFVVPLVSGEINVISQSTIVRGHSTSPAVDYRIVAWTIVAGGLLAIAIYAVAVSPAPDPGAVIAMTVQP
jgi:hypothetical protein